ncbi:MAG: hypothetical protein H5T74_07715 [Actinobacteria bacterium]|nr:hypothetical protein [Actinomycetota bacterium]MDI6831977.1 hypothetical protein [Actinomycetota bacterium]
MRLIFILGYFHWFAAINAMLGMKSMKNKLAFTGAIYAVPAFMNILAPASARFVRG